MMTTMMMVWLGSDSDMDGALSISYVLGYSIHKLGATKMRSLRRLGSRIVSVSVSVSFSFSSSFPLHSQVVWASFFVFVYLENHNISYFPLDFFVIFFSLVIHHIHVRMLSCHSCAFYCFFPVLDFLGLYKGQHPIHQLTHPS
jgi:hypothetical protein